MIRAALGLLLFACLATTAYAAISPVDGGIITTPDVPAGGKPFNFVITFYGPGASGSMEGPFATSMPDQSGQNIPHTLDDVRLQKSKYITLASDPSNYHKWYMIPYIKYRSVLDRKWYVLTDVVGYVHDTGGAFNGRPDKMDIATGNFSGYDQGQTAGIIGGDTASATWYQIGGQVDLNTRIAQSDGPSISTTPLGRPYTIGNPQSNTSPFSYGMLPPPPPPQQLNGGTGQPTSIGSPTNIGSGGSTGTGGSQLPATNPVSTVNPQPGSSLASQLLLAVRGTPTPAVFAGPPAATILVQPQVAAHGYPILVSWSSVGMKADVPCIVSVANFLFAKGNEGSKQFSTSQTTNGGTMTFMLQCTAQNGQAVSRSASIAIN